jgi:hypothetical protein
MSYDKTLPKENMKEYSKLLDNLVEMGVVRTYNSPVGDYGEWLVTCKLNLTLERNAQAGFDAIDGERRIRYQIKCRWERGEPTKNTRQLGIIRNLGNEHFQFLIVVIFNRDFDVKEAYQIPYNLVVQYGIRNEHQNGIKLFALGPILNEIETKDITKSLI